MLCSYHMCTHKILIKGVGGNFGFHGYILILTLEVCTLNTYSFLQVSHTSINCFILSNIVTENGNHFIIISLGSCGSEMYKGLSSMFLGFHITLVGYWLDLEPQGTKIEGGGSGNHAFFST